MNIAVLKTTNIMGQCWTCPDTGTAAVINRWGKYHSVAEAGCTPLVPCLGQGVSGVVNLRIQELRHKIEAKTKDNVFILVHFSIQYQVIPERISEAFYRLTNVQGQMESYIFDTVRAQVPMIPFDQVFLQKEEISKHIKDELSEAMESFGYIIVNSLITDIEPSQDLKGAMNEIVRQERLKMAAEYQGETQRILEVKNAEAEGEKIRIQAGADAEAKYLNGQGIARQRAAIINGMRDDVRNFSNAVGNVGPKDVLHLIILTQYLDTLRDVAAKSNVNAVFVPQTGMASGGSSVVADGIRDGFLQASMSQAGNL